MHPTLFDQPVFDGITFSPPHDQARLTGQLARVWELMMDGEWRTLAGIRDAVGGTEAAVSARLRDFRKLKHGGHRVDRRRVADSRGLWAYRVVR